MNDSDDVRRTTTRSGLLAAGSYILVVDDDPAMLGMIETVLAAEGWTVKGATDARSAHATVDASPVPPVLLICDVMMEGVDGLQLTRDLVDRLPGLKAILMSAHLADVSWWPTDLRDCPFLSKPFSNEQLLSTVRDSIAG